jgi:hypothetical protein
MPNQNGEQAHGESYCSTAGGGGVGQDSGRGDGEVHECRRQMHEWCTDEKAYIGTCRPNACQTLCRYNPSREKEQKAGCVCACKRGVHALHRTAEQTSPAACREDNSRGLRRYQASCTSLHNELMSMAIPTALAPHNVRPALAAQSLPQQLLPLRIRDVVPSYLKRSR